MVHSLDKVSCVKDVVTFYPDWDSAFKVDFHLHATERVRYFTFH